MQHNFINPIYDFFDDRYEISTHFDYYLKDLLIKTNKIKNPIHEDNDTKNEDNLINIKKKKKKSKSKNLKTCISFDEYKTILDQYNQFSNEEKLNYLLDHYQCYIEKYNIKTRLDIRYIILIILNINSLKKISFTKDFILNIDLLVDHVIGKVLTAYENSSNHTIDQINSTENYDVDDLFDFYFCNSIISHSTICRDDWIEYLKQSIDYKDNNINVECKIENSRVIILLFRCIIELNNSSENIIPYLINKKICIIPVSTLYLYFKKYNIISSSQQKIYTIFINVFLFEIFKCLLSLEYTRESSYTLFTFRRLLHTDFSCFEYLLKDFKLYSLATTK